MTGKSERAPAGTVWHVVWALCAVTPVLVACGGEVDQGRGRDPIETAKTDEPDAATLADPTPAASSGSVNPPDDPEPTAGGVRHPSCERGFPEPAPGVANVTFDATGRPLFDHWRDISCEQAAAEAPLCTEPGCNSCLRGEPGGAGVCTSFDIDQRCDGEGQVLTFNNHRCWVCSPLEVHARACCEGVSGFDCRVWPFPSDGPPGSVCARHEDCEPGLVCGPGGNHGGESGEYGGGYGICQCPGVTIAAPDSCWDLHD